MAWRKARKGVAVLQEQSTRFARGIDELHHATGGCPATVYEFAGGSVAYFAPEASDFYEAGELKAGISLRPCESSMSGACGVAWQSDFPFSTLKSACSASITETSGWGITFGEKLKDCTAI